MSFVLFVVKPLRPAAAVWVDFLECSELSELSSASELAPRGLRTLARAAWTTATQPDANACRLMASASFQPRWEHLISGWRRHQRRVKAVTSHRTPHHTHSGSVMVLPNHGLARLRNISPLQFPIRMQTALPRARKQGQKLRWTWSSKRHRRGLSQKWVDIEYHKAPSQIRSWYVNNGRFIRFRMFHQISSVVASIPQA